jgi:hypothetical protein
MELETITIDNVTHTTLTFGHVNVETATRAVETLRGYLIDEVAFSNYAGNCTVIVRSTHEDAPEQLLNSVLCSLAEAFR